MNFIREEVAEILFDIRLRKTSRCGVLDCLVHRLNVFLRWLSFETRGRKAEDEGEGRVCTGVASVNRLNGDWHSGSFLSLAVDAR